MMELERDTERSRQKPGRPRQVVPTRLVQIARSLRQGRMQICSLSSSAYQSVNGRNGETSAAPERNRLDGG